MIEDEHFIIETSEKINETPVELDTVPKNTFPVRTQLFLISIMMLLLFAGFIVPKTIALLKVDPSLAEVPIASLEITKNAASVPTYVVENLELNAVSAYVWDVTKQKVMFEKNPNDKLPLASITKLMTALVAYELVPDTTLITVSNEATTLQSGGSLVAGETYKVKDLADFALISSYNSAAHTLASSVGNLLGGGDSVAQFVAAMNIKAEELELSSLLYENPTGLDISATKAGAYGSARDTTLLMQYILLNYPEILTPTVAEYTRLYNQNGDYHDAENTNNVLTEIPNLLGSKTGYTDLAGGNLTIAFDAGYNRPVIVTVLGSTRSERFSDVKKLVAQVQKIIASEI